LDIVLYSQLNLRWSYVNATQDCSISILCGSATIPDGDTINTPGDGNNIPIADPIPATISATPGDCSCTNDLELSSTCLGGTVQSNAMGDYVMICVGDNNTHVYQHSSNNVYIYYVANLQKWMISSGIGGTAANIGISSSQICAYEHSSLDTKWNFYDGNNYVEDCSMDLICKNSRGMPIPTNLPVPRGLPIPRNSRGMPIPTNLPVPRGLPIPRNIRRMPIPTNLPVPRGLPIPRNIKRSGLGKSVERSGGCSSGYRITLDDKGIEHQPDTAGDYVEVCSADGIPVYRQSANNYYLYQLEASGDTYWFISNKAGDSTFLLLLFTANAPCPDDNNMVLVKTGPGVNDFAPTSDIGITAI
jgi:hypothetical protein